MIKIFENLLPVSLQNRIEQTVNDDMFPWFFMDNIKTQREYSDQVLQDMPKWDMSKVVESFGLVHLVCLRDQANSPHFEMFRSVLYLLEKQQGFEIDSILRVRIRRTVKTEGSNESTYNTPHVDLMYEKPFLTFVYYIEESDGDTLFFDRCFEKGSNDAEKAEPKILQRVKYKKGNGVLFDGHRFHAGNSPSNYLKRTVVNYDFTIKN